MEDVYAKRMGGGGEEGCDCVAAAVGCCVGQGCAGVEKAGGGRDGGEVDGVDEWGE